MAAARRCSVMTMTVTVTTTATITAARLAARAAHRRNDWNRGQRVNDYRRYHLQRPPRGYEWRRVDNNYVLAAAATGLIMGLVLANQ